MDDKEVLPSGAAVNGNEHNNSGRDDDHDDYRDVDEENVGANDEMETGENVKTCPEEGSERGNSERFS